MEQNDYEVFRDSILYVFKKRKTAFLTTESILKEVHFQKAVFPKEDKERLHSLLETMRDQDLVTLNQPKFAALTATGKMEVEKLTEARIGEIEKSMEERSK
jgi:hypothetical protein